MSRFQLWLVMGFALILGSAVPAAAGMNATEWLQRMEQARPRRLTISHGAIRTVGMPAMTMTFPAGDSSYLAMLHKGDAIEIHVANRGGLIEIVDFRMNH